MRHWSFAAYRQAKTHVTIRAGGWADNRGNFMSMNREAALEDFVSRNLTLLTSKQFDRKDFKAASRRYFYEQHKNKHGSPGLGDVLNALVLFLRKRGTPLDRIDAMIDKLPAFRQIGERQIENLKGLLWVEKPTSVLSESQLEDIRKVGAFAAVERHKGSEIEARKTNELREQDRQIQEKRQEYDQLPSVLEQEVIEEPEFDPEAEQIRRWWERFYLRDDPFRRKDGLDSIDKSLYDAVVVRTKPFTEALGLLARNAKGMFGTASLLLGDYGFGKDDLHRLSFVLPGEEGHCSDSGISGRPHPDAGGFIDTSMSDCEPAFEPS
jgi:hypothetical protein